MNKHSSRREFLEFMGRAGVAAAFLPTANALLGCATPKSVMQTLPFVPLAPSADDNFTMAAGFTHEILIRAGQPLGRGLSFGSDNDYIAFFPFPNNADEALLWVNHESMSPLFVSGYNGGDKVKTLRQVRREQKEVGGSIIRIRRENAQAPWKFVGKDSYNRRFDALTPIPFSGGPILGSKRAIGTLANCAGGVTPWRTVLTCEENYHYFYGETIYADGQPSHQPSPKKKLAWHHVDHRPPEHYGWVVEVNPFTGAAKKLTALGRFAHENATTWGLKDGRCVVYMGDDTVNQCLYKFISSQRDSLEQGELFVANLDKGEWVSLSWAKNPLINKSFKSAVDALIRTREAATLVGGTKLDRPEDIEIDPKTKAILISLTNNEEKKNYFGSILKIVEENNDPLAMKFKSSVFMAGGEASTFSCPDNMVFDHRGNLWLCCDIPGDELNKGVYTPFKNNGLFYIPMSGPRAGRAYQVASAPMDAELTGPCFSADGQTLFLSVQHPGEYSKDLKNITSHWPDGGNSYPKSAVLTIGGPAMKALVNT